MNLTSSQKQRLRELGWDGSIPDFDNKKERDQFFNKTATKLKNRNKERFLKLLENKVPSWRRVERKLRNIFYELGFVEVQTPSIISPSLLEKMDIGEESKLYNQIYQIKGEKKSLRPMLAPNLYRELRYFSRISDEEVIRLFELGSCFRKENGGERHLNEFKMLNAVEMGNIKDTKKRLDELISNVFSPFANYKVEKEKSTVYEETVDVNIKNTEVASCVIGPHFLDSNWHIDEPWVGLGIGVERLTRVIEGEPSVKPFGKSYVYQDGIRLDIE
ncbi:hypothetical protein AKJ51_03665 [candidate division MSBL1 archaeon SCGC-AAA382A20]|uniref:Aminoacyl-transfer RNA synthetases class-II family profile domain-containing protein n=1 Tax=candidate division MSBL1 archaeon SCGC-AAA382A20 TaxID=1698280 RepID=A0A133VJ52_9EURY|nr:hypothetical protein AKJ51_03665 [candidate division MSBL1 archaeon SCGC-AAA382A20]